MIEQRNKHLERELEKANKVFDYVAKYNFNGLVYTVVRNKAIEEIKKG